MTIQLNKIIPPFTSMSTDEQLEKVKEIRHIKYVLKPDVKQRKAKASKKATAKRSEKAKVSVNNLMKNLTKEQMIELMKELQT